MVETARALRLCLTTAVHAAPFMVALQWLMSAAEAVVVPIQTYGVKLLVDGLTQSVRSTIVWGVFTVLGALAVALVANLVTGQVKDTTEEKLFGWICPQVLHTMAWIPGLRHHESPTLANRVEYIRQHSSDLGFSFQIIMGIVATVGNSTAVVWLLASAHPALVVLPLLGAARIWSAAVGTRWKADATEGVTPQRRVVSGLISMCKDPRHALEVRVFGLSDVLVDRLTKLQDDRSRAENRAAIRAGVLDGAVRIGFALTYAVAIGWVVARVGAGELGAGDVAMVILLAPQVDQMASGLAGSFAWLAGSLRTFIRYDWLRRYADENAWTDVTASVPCTLQSGIELDSVTFSYPETDRRVLTDVSLILPAGSTIALVGENGAGKTTLVNLLTRMYDPDDGRVLVDGIDLRAVDVRQWRQQITAGFQDFVKFEFLAREAVGLGDTDRIDDRKHIRGALDRAGAADLVDKLPQGMDTQLGRQFPGGHDLSGGQWQRIALARAFMRKKPLLLLLDEPTAALDPEAEHALFERFATAAKESAAETGGITVLVSHRFSTVRMADLIVVLERGRVVETGDHEQLIATNGRYAELFEMQARAYR
jgi:ATP-binding cassette, subfamily B, bacterial